MKSADHSTTQGLENSNPTQTILALKTNPTHIELHHQVARSHFCHLRKKKTIIQLFKLIYLF